MEFRILGAFEVARNGERLDFRASRERTLLALLVLNVNRIVASDRLADELWSGAPPEGASKTLRVYVSRVRQGLGDEGNLIVTRPGGYLLEADPRAIDAVRFEGLVAQGREEAAGGNYRMAAGTLRRLSLCGAARRWPMSSTPPRPKRRPPGSRRRALPPSRTASRRTWPVGVTAS